MKIRNGFVSNSSSSSFIIGVSKDIKITKQNIVDAFHVDKKSPLYSLVNQFADFILDNMKTDTLCTRKSLLTDFEYVFDEDVKKLSEDKIKKVLKKETYYPINQFVDDIMDPSSEYNFYLSSAASDGDSIERVICELSFDIREDDFIFVKEESY